MLLLKYFALAVGIGAVAVGVALIVHDLYRRMQFLKRVLPEGAEPGAEPPVRFRQAGLLGVAALVPLLLSTSIVVVPAGSAGVRVSQISGTRPGTLYPGSHFVKPMIESVELYDTREQVLHTAAPENKGDKEHSLQVTSREGLAVGMAITVRYRLDPNRLDYIHSHLPHPVERELVPAVVFNAFREITPQHTVREIFSSERERIRQRAAEEITRKLSADGVILKEVMLKDVVLPAEFAKGVESLLLKEQENEGLRYVTEMRQKQVRIAELEAEAARVRQVKHAEAEAQTRVLQAKGEADSMQHLLPLKQKQIEQSRLEAEARKEATVKNAEAAAAAKVIDSKAELERRNLMAQAEANRIRVTAAADSERMQSEAVALRQNPLLINKIMAERLSDKIQVMMVPTDGRFFFNDMLQNSIMPQVRSEEMEPARSANTRSGR